MSDIHNEPETASAEKISENLAKIGLYYQRILQELMHKTPSDSTSVVDPFHMASSFVEAWGQFCLTPEKILHHQNVFLEHYLALLENITTRFASATSSTEPLYETAAKDMRFRDPAWNTHPLFNFLKQSYLMTSEWVESLVADLPTDSPKDAEKIRFFTKQWLNAVAPTNFLFSNPEVLRSMVDSQGDTIVKGMEHVLQDLLQNNSWTLTTTDMTAFQVGGNLAITPGVVVYQNRLMQLIQYRSVTESSYEKPLLVVPPWINKYYILDLKPENSWVRWLVAQGYTVFMISWVNPAKELADIGFEDYMYEGPLQALDVIQKTLHVPSVNAVGYCLGGTLLAATLSYMESQKDRRISAATFFTTLLDFREAGDLSVFIDEPQICSIEERMAQDGYFDGRDMATIFSLLRANDMIWPFVVNHYLLGKDPLPFDLLFWNADSTRLPGRMHSFYLRNMYQHNRLAEPGGITLKGTPIDLRSITIPSYFLATAEDHIAPWKAVYRGSQLISAAKRFVLAASGHIAGVVNPPVKQKYHYWSYPLEETPSFPEESQEWFTHATMTPGSWWPDWHLWHQSHAGARIPAPSLPSADYEAAPGSYVLQR